MTESNSKQTDVEVAVMAIVNRIGDPLLMHIYKYMHEQYDHPQTLVTQAVRKMVQRGDLRMKDDDIDHVGAYRMTSQGEKRFGYENETSE